MRTAEQAIHEAVWKHIEWRKLPGVAVFHPANGEARNPIVGAKLKRMGVKSGVADLVGFVPSERAGEKVPVFFALELKGPQGRLAKEQRAFLDLVADAGGFSAWASSIDEALEYLTEWGVIAKGGRA